MISYKKSFDFTASDDELYDYVEKMIDVMVGDIDPKVEFDFENDENHRSRVINATSDRTRFNVDRIAHYFDSEVRNRLREEDRESMTLFAEQVVGFDGKVPWWDENQESSSNPEPVNRRRASS